MSRRLVQVLYNPGSINSVGQDIPVPMDESNKTLVSLQSANLTQLLQLTEDLHLESLKNAGGHHHILIQIKKQLTNPVDLSGRILFLKKFNSAILVLAEQTTSNATVFQACIQVISMMKEIVENEPQPLGADSRGEWVELEKSICHLSHWEGQLEFYWSSIN